MAAYVPQPRGHLPGQSRPALTLYDWQCQPAGQRLSFLGGLAAEHSRLRHHTLGFSRAVHCPGTAAAVHAACKPSWTAPLT